MVVGGGADHLSVFRNDGQTEQLSQFFFFFLHEFSCLSLNRQFPAGTAEELFFH